MPALPDSGPDPETLIVRHLGQLDYEPVWRNMQSFTDTRSANTPDELWFLEHSPVFTLGRNGKPEHLHDTADIPVIKVDRGGQVTYHGPGQLMAYSLLDINRRQLGVQSLVRILEQTVINLLSDYSIDARRREKAPGVYVDDRKIAALGLRVRKGCCFHGLSLNIDMNLTPFSMIDPCGFHGLEVTQLRDLGIDASIKTVSLQFQEHFRILLDQQVP
jgi:lipoyl(octanoyl) transferase